MLAISSTLCETLQQRGRAVLLDEVCRRLRFGLAALLGEALDESFDAFRQGRSGQHRVDGHRGAAGQFRKSSRQPDLRGLGDAVVDHFLRNVQPGFGGDEDDAAPIALQHALQIGARKPHPRHHVDLEKAGPVLVGNFEEVFRLENSRVVDEDIHLRQRGYERVATGRGRDVGGNAADLGSGNRSLKFCDRGVDLGLAAAVQHNIGA